MTLRIVVLFALSAVAVFAQAPAQPPVAAPVQIPVIADPTTITEIYRLAIGNWATAATRDINALFGVLALLELSWTTMTLFFDRHSLDSAIPLMMRKMAAISFFAMLMANAGTWMPEIINTFVDLGKRASGIQGLGPSEILKTGVNIAGRLLWSAGSAGIHLDFLTALAFILAAAMILAGFLIVCAHFIMCLIQVYFAVGIGFYMLWLGASRWTVSYVERYFSFCVTAGIQLMTMYLVAGTGLILARNWQNLTSNTAETWGGTITGWIIGACALLYGLICWFVPKKAAAVIGGAPNMSLGDVTSLAAPAIAASVAVAGTIATAASAGAAAPVAGTAGIGAAGAGMASAAGTGSSSPPPATTGSGSGGGHASPGPGIMGGLAQTASNLLSRLPSSNGSGSPPHSNVGH